MATVINLPQDPRYEDWGEDIGSAITTIVQEKKKKELERQFSEAFKKINAAGSYEEAVQSMSDLDPKLLTNKEALATLSEQINIRFPEQEMETVYDKDNKPHNIAHRKGTFASDEELAAKGYRRGNVAGVGKFLSFDEASGEVDIDENVTEADVKKKYPTRSVFDVEDSDNVAALKNAIANRISAEAQRIAAGKKGEGADNPTEFEQTVTATAQRLGLDEGDSYQRNQAINVVKGAPPAREGYMGLLTNKMGSQIDLTSADLAGSVSVGSSVIEPSLLSGASPDDAAKSAYSAFAYTYLNRPQTEQTGTFSAQTRKKLERGFTDITGMSVHDAYLINAVDAADKKLQEGQTGMIEVTGKDGRSLGTIIVTKQGGKTYPVGTAGD